MKKNKEKKSVMTYVKIHKIERYLNPNTWTFMNSAPWRTRKEGEMWWFVKRKDHILTVGSSTETQDRTAVRRGKNM